MTYTNTNEIIKDDDVISRWIITPIHIKTMNDGSVIVDPTQTFQFQTKANPSLSESVNCHRLLDNDNQKIHDMGKLSNDNKRQDNPNSNKEYIGFIEANVGVIRKYKESFISFEVKHSPNSDNHGHCDLLMVVDGNNEVNNNIKSCKTLAKIGLRKCFGEIIRANVIQD
jgi:hypothetical protein